MASILRRRPAAAIATLGLLAAGTVAAAWAAALATLPPRVLVARPVPAVARAAPKPRPAPAPALTATPFVVTHILPVDGPMRHGEWHWDEAGSDPAAPLVITVDLAAQVLSAFRGGREIGTAVILYGADAKPTPLGVYPITQKARRHTSNLYDAPMPYMLRLTNDGITIHASPVAEGYMTHGCIGVPLPFAARLFGAAKLGDKVIVTRGETLALGQAITAA
jgi:lipoprotein-anchoring transpeptidase ErfK/SrfK